MDITKMINNNRDNFAIVGTLKTVVVKTIKTKEGKELQLYTYTVLSTRTTAEGTEYVKDRYIDSWEDLKPQMNVTYIWFGYLKATKFVNKNIVWKLTGLPADQWKTTFVLQQIQVQP